MDRPDRDEMWGEESENSDALSSDESVIGFLWSGETPDDSALQADAVDDGGSGAAEVQDKEDQREELAGALARYGTWLSSLDGVS